MIGKTRCFIYKGSKMATDEFDMIVVGAGIIGTCAAYHSQKAGLRTLLLEQYPLGHSFGSSAGKSRIIRHAHTDPQYLPLVKDSYEQIAEMEKKRGEKLWIKTGMVWMGEKNEIEGVAKILNDYKCDHELVSSAEVGKRYPSLKYGPEWAGLIDPMAGCILADRWLAVYQDEFRKAGGTIYDETRVDSFENGDNVIIRTRRGEFRSKNAIFALGTWINKLLPDLPVQTRNELISVAYWKAKKTEDSHLTEPENYPILLADEKRIGWYSLPSVDYKGAVKFAYHQGEVYDINNEIVDMDQKFIDATREHIRTHLPFLDSENGPWRVDRCKYAMSPDEHYVVDFLPGSKNIQVVGCMSGTGYKNGPSLGKALTQIALGQRPFADLSSFSLDRFKQKSKM
ncbi:hypothetical protein PMAYCL1PPCAC_30435 [Pristionchus mayeri]|uniref:FAD dependent oxidoreductase domain-containing protein n=1 Tax=Pristionchus mayeri TaxID=1317129 RepID=A0AAN5IDP2_9BILA|nr:hypothetical protein PMAYCL1PPCAC_30435 [Pristionchus mayeri]